MDTVHTLALVLLVLAFAFVAGTSFIAVQKQIYEEAVELEKGKRGPIVIEAVIIEANQIRLFLRNLSRRPVEENLLLLVKGKDDVRSVPVSVELPPLGVKEIRAPFEAKGLEKGSYEVSVDGTKTVVEVRESFLPNLRPVSVLLSPERPLPLQDTNIYVTVCNEGPVQSSDVNVELDVEGKTLSKGLGSLGPGSCTMLVFSYTFELPGPHIISVTVDPEDRERELSEADNRLSKEILVEYPEVDVALLSLEVETNNVFMPPEPHRYRNIVFLAHDIDLNVHKVEVNVGNPSPYTLPLRVELESNCMGNKEVNVLVGPGGGTVTVYSTVTKGGDLCRLEVKVGYPNDPEESNNQRSVEVPIWLAEGCGGCEECSNDLLSMAGKRGIVFLKADMSKTGTCISVNPVDLSGVILDGNGHLISVTGNALYLSGVSGLRVTHIRLRSGYANALYIANGSQDINLEYSVFLSNYVPVTVENSLRISFRDCNVAGENRGIRVLNNGVLVGFEESTVSLERTRIDISDVNSGIPLVFIGNSYIKRVEDTTCLGENVIIFEGNVFDPEGVCFAQIDANNATVTFSGPVINPLWLNIRNREINLASIVAENVPFALLVNYGSDVNIIESDIVSTQKPIIVRQSVARLIDTNVASTADFALFLENRAAIEGDRNAFIKGYRGILMNNFYTGELRAENLIIRTTKEAIQAEKGGGTIVLRQIDANSALALKAVSVVTLEESNIEVVEGPAIFVNFGASGTVTTRITLRKASVVSETDRAIYAVWTDNYTWYTYFWSYLNHDNRLLLVLDLNKGDIRLGGGDGIVSGHGRIDVVVEDCNGGRLLFEYGTNPEEAFDLNTSFLPGENCIGSTQVGSALVGTLFISEPGFYQKVRFQSQSSFSQAQWTFYEGCCQPELNINGVAYFSADGCLTSCSANNINVLEVEPTTEINVEFNHGYTYGRSLTLFLPAEANWAGDVNGVTVTVPSEVNAKAGKFFEVNLVFHNPGDTNVTLYYQRPSFIYNGTVYGIDTAPRHIYIDEDPYSGNDLGLPLCNYKELPLYLPPGDTVFTLRCLALEAGNYYLRIGAVAVPLRVE